MVTNCTGFMETIEHHYLHVVIFRFLATFLHTAKVPIRLIAWFRPPSYLEILWLVPLLEWTYFSWKSLNSIKIEKKLIFTVVLFLPKSIGMIIIIIIIIIIIMENNNNNNGKQQRSWKILESHGKVTHNVVTKHQTSSYSRHLLIWF